MNFLKKFFLNLFFFILLFSVVEVTAQKIVPEKLLNQLEEEIKKENYPLASQILQKILDKDSNNISTLCKASAVYSKLNNFPAAIQYSKKLTVLQPGNANHFTNTGWFLILNKEYREAEKYCLQALLLNNGSYVNYLNLGHVYSFLKQQNKGLEYYYKAIAYLPNKEAYQSILSDFSLFEQLGNFPFNITGYKNMVEANYNQVFLKKAYGNNILDSIYRLTVIENYHVDDEKIIELKEKFLIEEQKNDKLRLTVLRDFYWSLGWLHLNKDSKSIAINEYFTNVIRISNDLKDTSFVIDALYKVGASFELDAGFSLIKQGLDLAQQSNDYHKQYLINLLLGDKLNENFRTDSALTYFRNAQQLALLSGIADANQVATNRMMLTFNKRKQYDSVTYYYQLLKKENVAKGLNSENSFADDYNYTSFLTATGKPAAAIQLGKEVLHHYAGEKEINVSGMYELLGKAYINLSKEDSAKYYFHAAINNYIQFIKSNPQLTQQTPLKERYASYDYLKQLALASNDINSLFDLTEQTKASSLYAKLTGNVYAPASITLSQLAKDLKNDELVCSFNGSGLTNSAFAIAVSGNENILVKENKELLNALFKKHSTVQWTALNKKANEAIAPLKNFTEEAELNTFHLNLMILIAGGLHNMMQAGNTRGVIKLQDKTNNYDAEMLAYNDIIYQLYIKPFEKILEGKKTIYLSPDMFTTLIPFEAIKNGKGEYLGSLYNIIYVNSFTSRAIIKSTAKPGNKTMLAVGNPEYNLFKPHNTRGRAYDFSLAGIKSFADLPGTAKELQAIRQDVPGATILERNQLTETDIKKLDASGELANYDILHFAVHGISSINDYQDNTLIVAEPPGTANDGFLQFNEMANLHLNASLVCLSACETAAGLPSADEDIRNLPTAFFLAGAHAVIATWWKIDDEATGIFMASFYRLVFKENKSYTEALLLTRQKFISGEYGNRYQSPYYWAAFKFFGN